MKKATGKVWFGKRAGNLRIFQLEFLKLKIAASKNLGNEACGL